MHLVSFSLVAFVAFVDLGRTLILKKCKNRPFHREIWTFRTPQKTTNGAGFSCLILPEIVFLAQFFLLFWRQRLEIASPTGAEIDLPTPKTADQRLGILVILRTKLAILTRILHNI